MTLSIVFVLLASHFVTQKRGTTERRSEAACDLKSQFPLHTSRRGEEFMDPLEVAAEEALESLRNKQEENFPATFSHELISILLSHLRRATPDRRKLIFHASEPFAFKFKWEAAWKPLRGQSFPCFSARWTCRKLLVENFCSARAEPWAWLNHNELFASADVSKWQTSKRQAKRDVKQIFFHPIIALRLKVKAQSEAFNEFNYCSWKMCN